MTLTYPPIRLTATAIAVALTLASCSGAAESSVVTVTASVVIAPPWSTPPIAVPSANALTNSTGPTNSTGLTNAAGPTNAAGATNAAGPTNSAVPTNSAGPTSSSASNLPTAGTTDKSATSSAATGNAITTNPAPGATGVSPIAPVVVRATTGKLSTVSFTNPVGKLIPGSYSADERTWTSIEPLAYDREYTIDATATGPAGDVARTAQFTTLKPRQTVFPSFFPNPKMKTIGIGQPMVVIFDKPPVDRAAAEKTLTVTTVPAVNGSWYWWDNRTLHYRPPTYWQPGTRIAVNAKAYGVNFGGGMYGEIDRTLNVTVGPAKIARIDDATKKMQVFVNDKLVRTIPVAMGRNQEITVKGKKISFVTPSGIYVAQEKYAVRRMSSATYGLPTTYDLGYDKYIPLAVRISAGGVFVHSAPWSVADQGVRNVSHGCINISPEAAKWFYSTFSFGDVVQVTGTSTKLAPTDGFGDWNIPWSQWQKGSALP